MYSISPRLSRAVPRARGRARGCCPGSSPSARHGSLAHTDHDGKPRKRPLSGRKHAVGRSRRAGCRHPPLLRRRRRAATAPAWPDRARGRVRAHRRFAPESLQRSSALYQIRPEIWYSACRSRSRPSAGSGSARSSTARCPRPRAWTPSSRRSA